MPETTKYTVQVLRSGQPRAFADTEREYLITIEASQYGKEGLFPYVMHGDVEKQIRREEADRAALKMFSGYPPERLRVQQHKWAINLVKVLCQNFREKGDDDGKVGMEAHFYPTLKSLTINHAAGTVRAFIIEPFTD